MPLWQISKKNHHTKDLKFANELFSLYGFQVNSKNLIENIKLKLFLFIFEKLVTTAQLIN